MRNGIRIINDNLRLKATFQQRFSFPNQTAVADALDLDQKRLLQTITFLQTASTTQLLQNLFGKQEDAIESIEKQVSFDHAN